MPKAKSRMGHGGNTFLFYIRDLALGILFPGSGLKRSKMKGKVFKILLGLTGFFLIFQINFWLPGNGGNVCALTTAEEQKLGEDVVREVEAKFSVIHDPLILEYLNGLGGEILKQAGTQPYPFHFYLLKDSQLNAFSVPGGYIFITTGIIEIMNSEGELAGLLGHEITHLSHHHISSQIEKQKKIGLSALALALLGVLAGDPAIAAATIAGSMATATTLFLKYSREDESDADNYGFKYMSGAGFDPKGMLELLDKLRRWGSFGSEGVPAYMLTHPLTADRMSNVEDLLHQYANQGPWVRKTSDEFRRVQTIILTNYGDLQRARNLFQSWAKDTQTIFWVYYGQGWIDIRERKFDEAIDQFEKALTIKPQTPYVVRDQGQVFFLKGNFEKAIQKLGQASILDSKDAGTAFFLGRAYQEKGENLLALENFQRALKLGSEGEELFYYLGVSYGNLNNLGQAHYYFGKSFKLKGDKIKAKFHYQTALKYVEKDPVQKERIEKEIKSLETGKEKEKKPERK